MIIQAFKNLSIYIVTCKVLMFILNVHHKKKRLNSGCKIWILIVSKFYIRHKVRILLMSFIVKGKLQFFDCNEVSKLLYKLIVSWGYVKFKYRSFHAQALCFSIAIHTTIILEEEYLTLCIYKFYWTWVQFFVLILQLTPRLWYKKNSWHFAFINYRIWVHKYFYGVWLKMFHYFKSPSPNEMKIFYHHFFVFFFFFGFLEVFS
jgi:hypothetical protein